MKISLLSIIKKTSVLIVAVSCLIITLFSTVHLIDFLSWITGDESTATQQQQKKHLNEQYYDDPDKLRQLERDTRLHFIMDIVLLTLFVLQHSMLATDSVKSWFSGKGTAINALQRSFYLLCTSISIELLIMFWHPLDNIVIWRIDALQPYSQLIKSLAKLLLLVELIVVFDVLEFTGLKQVYRYIMNMEEKPLFPAHCSYLQSMRHPNLIGVMLLVWSSHKMTLDLLSICIFFMSYMFIGHSMPTNDRKAIGQHWYNLLKWKSN
ncbi:hypothetical protein SAMD00019534_011580 [Acytostelium subglobosum LB1]|uniref:hypothetical protein n=1 Tax=Acytostelium subglobosum LB1 TaxID=1410327 RepID=UPI000644CF86|nr:hypothetical protein SAMD00019534_011580 [Acytostelium subglobosum LB1]GAM17983.1 hypothetical protein SAMD00019534_011580 [Acytostelium subglobosum LB1]|eukprot:XP_012758579.1 hypothetical protein SAMD00019534_011580 [Acytostelium subglobosum LB1]